MNATVECVPVGLPGRSDGRVSLLRQDFHGPLTGLIYHELPVAECDRVAPAVLLLFEGDFDTFPLVFDLLGQVRPEGGAEVRVGLRNGVDPFIDLHHQAVDVVGVLGIKVDRFDPPAKGLEHSAHDIRADLETG